MKIIKRIKKEKRISQPHDLAFRNAMADRRVAEAFLLNALEPEVAELFNFSTLKHESEMYANEKLRLLATDVLLSVEYKGIKGRKVYFLIEHISTPDKFIAFRMIKGTVAVVERELRKENPAQIPLIIPLVFCNTETAFTYPNDINDLLEEDERKLGKQYMFGQFKLIDLNRISDKEIQKHGMSSVLELMLKHGRQLYKMPEIVEILLDKMAGLYKGAMDYITGMLNYASEMLDEEAGARFIERFGQKLKPKEREKFMVSYAEHLRQEGRQEGIKKGMLKTAVAFLKAGIDVKTILQITGLSMAEIDKAIKEKN